MPQSARYDIAIAGGGPAGSMAASMLAGAGFRVALVTRLSNRPRLEGLSPRVVAMLRAHGLPLDGVTPPRQRRARWGDFQGDQNVEHIVRRDVFDRGLLTEAQARGVGVIEGSIAGVSPKHRSIRLADGRDIAAELLFEARGRRATRLHDCEGRAAQIGPETISVAGFVAGRPCGGLGSEVMSRAEGWTWRACLGDDRDWLQVVGDARGSAGSRGETRLKRLWHRVLGPDAEDTPLPPQPLVSAASLRLNAPVLDPRCPRLGDAAVAIDPLSGHGLFWAVSSALMAPPIARALLDGEGALARDFYHDRVVGTFWRQARIGRDLHAESGHDGAFWQARRTWPDREPAHPAVGRPRIEERVLVRDGVLSRGEVLVTNDDPGGAAFVFGQEIAPVLRAMGDRPLPDAKTFHREVLPEVPATLAGQLHGWLLSRGLGDGPALQS